MPATISGSRLASCLLGLAPVLAAVLVCAAEADTAAQQWVFVMLCLAGAVLAGTAVVLRRAARARGALLAVVALWWLVPVTLLCWSPHLLGLPWPAAVVVGVILAALCLRVLGATARRRTRTPLRPEPARPAAGPVPRPTRPPAPPPPWFDDVAPEPYYLPYDGPPPTEPPRATG